MMRRCTKCVMPDTRPRIEFDENGVCNACNYAMSKQHIHWRTRKKKFIFLLEKFKTDKGYDCIVPCSGGKDSTYVAYQLKYEYGMHPLAVTVAPNMYTDAGKKNMENFQKVGIDHILFTLNKEVLRKLARKTFIEYGDPFIPWVTSIYSVPLQMAIKMGIRLVVYGECGEVELGGRTDIDGRELGETVLRETIKTGSADDFKTPENWGDDEITHRDIEPYIIPSKEELSDVTAIYYGFYHLWDDHFHYQFVKEKVGFFETEERKEGTYSNYSSIDDKLDDLYIHLAYRKFGFGRCTKDACKDIRAGIITREQALEYVKKYDAEPPMEYLVDVLDFLNMTGQEYYNVLDKFTKTGGVDDRQSEQIHSSS
jgi:N-acetyl sugar amidotransferase